MSTMPESYYACTIPFMFTVPICNYLSSDYTNVKENFYRLSNKCYLKVVRLAEKGAIFSYRDLTPETTCIFNEAYKKCFKFKIVSDFFQIFSAIGLCL